MENLSSISVIKDIQMPTGTEAKRLKQACDDFESFFCSTTT